MASPSFAGTSTGAAIGTAIIGPGGGTLAGAAIGFAFDLGNWVFASGNEHEAKAIQAGAEALDYRTRKLQTGLQVKQAKSDVSAYESFLAAFPGYAELQKDTFEAQSRSEFRGLLENFGSGNAIGGATGRAGGSFGLAVADAGRELADFAGSDLALGGVAGGRYQLGKDDLADNLAGQERQARGQLDILKSSIGVLEETLGIYDKAEASAEKTARKEKSAATWWNPFD